MTAPTSTHGTEPPSLWVQRWAHLIPQNSTVLDVACGRGRHMRYLSQQGHAVVGVDRDAQAIAAVADLGEAIEADIENAAWPLPNRQFGAVVVTNYLWRPVWPSILSSLAPGAVLIYETFAAGNETVGKPSRPDFLLQPGELLSRCAGLRVVAYEDGFLNSPERFVQRIVAVQTLATQRLVQRFHLSPSLHSLE
ncbi:bifunctional 2-polyprenyl-6-hydroxyphenol methylase/3-demethylubiquinol 3-O-methyltransferase UbiG [Limnohabitans sp. JirII-31]|uniref:class I SAM-dependent methyltransferase n=1 Tax=Limnohabitans sp. JirII-31 TaxID=1977908 RepID=UPI000C1ECC15|nr:class I SAM-dependent methyltransferase [Limnohabitans sp. JirII-31]PIT77255.1 SAM-dependent methyltransferase [Limnohabitans sp. JirII-31]